MKNQSIAIIPARGGSKRIPRKNIRPFLGKPILEYSVRAALDSGCFSEVMVSTDDPEIAAIAKEAGANVPFMRSGKNADDYATTLDVLKEVIDVYQQAGQTFDSLCCIYPTAPFVTAERLRDAAQLLTEKQADCVLPVVRFGYPIQRALKIRDGQAEMFWPEHSQARSQDLETAYHDAGQFYFVNAENLNRKTSLFEGRVFPMVVSEMEVQDIDHEEDWKMAEMKYQLRYAERVTGS